jgi:hypothetical protein
MINVLIKETPEFSCLFYHVRTQQVGTICEAGNRPSPDIRSAATSILDFLVSGTMRNKFLVFLIYPFWELKQPKRAKITMRLV